MGFFVSDPPAAEGKEDNPEDEEVFEENSAILVALNGEFIFRREIRYR